MASTSSIIIFVSIFLVCMCISSFFSAAETAYSSVSKLVIETKAKEGKKSAKLIKKHYGNFGWTISTILIGNNVVNVALSSITTYFLVDWLGASTTVTIISTAILTPMLVIFGEIFPKILAKKHSYGYLVKIVYIIHFLNIVLYPVTFLFAKYALSSKVNITEKELKDMISIAANQNELLDEEALIAQRALELDSILVKDIMTPRDKIIYAKEDSFIDDVLKIFQQSGHSRLPVINKKSKFIGVVFLKDVVFLKHEEKKNKMVKDFVIDVPWIQQNKKVNKAFEFKRMNNSHMSFIFKKNKDKKVAIGIITIEDIIEELVGELYDEHDNEKYINQISPTKWIAPGQSLMSEICNHIHKELINDVDAEDMTLKKWIQSRMNKKIKTNHKYSYKKILVFKVISNKNKEDTIFEIRKKLK